MKSWVVVNIGCIECSVSSNVVGVFADKEEAEHVAEHLQEKLHWRNGGQNEFEVFELLPVGEIHPEYEEALGRTKRHL